MLRAAFGASVTVAVILCAPGRRAEVLAFDLPPDDS